MKRVIVSLLAAAAVLVSCRDKADNDRIVYYVDDSGTFLFTASVESLGGEWRWDAALCKVGLYTENDNNALFQPRASYDGKSGEAQIFGPAVNGQAYAYLPYSLYGYPPAKEGCMLLGAEQDYFPGAIAQIEGNTPVLVAAAGDDGRLEFRHMCGALHLKVKIHFSENVQRLALTANEPVCGYLNVQDGTIADGGNSLVVKGIDRPCTESSPLDVWVMLPEGSYSGLYITVSGETESISTVLEGDITITTGEESPATVSEKKNSYEGSDFDSEEVSYD